MRISGYSVEPGLAYREEVAGAAPDDQVTLLLPSLGAKYRGLWKTCQEENGARPQNLWFGVSNLSTGSGVTAVFHYATKCRYVPFIATPRN